MDRLDDISAILLESGVASQYDYTPSGFLHIETPYTYPNGEHVSLYIREDETGYEITDLNHTAELLENKAPCEEIAGHADTAEEAIGVCRDLAEGCLKACESLHED